MRTFGHEGLNHESLLCTLVDDASKDPNGLWQEVKGFQKNKKLHAEVTCRWQDLIHHVQTRSQDAKLPRAFAELIQLVPEVGVELLEMTLK